MISYFVNMIAISLQSNAMLFEHVNIVNVETGQIQRNQAILVEDKKIKAISAKISVPRGTKKIDASGKYAIPGLWDAHIHWYDSRYFPLFTANGVTHARVMYGSPLHLSWKKRIAAGEIVGPDLEVGSPIVDGPIPVWPGSIACKSAEDGIKAVDKVVADGYDFVKVYSLLPRDAYFAIANRSKEKKIRFEGHIPRSITAIEAAEVGQSTVEHLMEMILGSSTKLGKLETIPAQSTPEKSATIGRRNNIATMAGFSGNLAAELAKVHRIAGVVHCPTLAVLYAIANLNTTELTKDSRLEYMPKSLVKSWDPKSDFRFKNYTVEDWKIAKDRYRLQKQLVKILFENGVTLIAGTDCLNPYTYPGFSIHDELRLLVECGLSPLTALRAATLNPAKLFKRDYSGKIKNGFAADFVLLNANPLQDIGNTKSIDSVVQAGTLFSRSQLDTMLENCKKLAASGTESQDLARVGYCCDDY